MNDDLEEFLAEAGSDTEAETKKQMKKALGWAAKHNRIANFAMQLIHATKVVKSGSKKIIINTALLLSGINYMDGKSFNLNDLLGGLKREKKRK